MAMLFALAFLLKLHLEMLSVRVTNFISWGVLGGIQSCALCGIIFFSLLLVYCFCFTARRGEVMFLTIFYVSNRIVCKCL